MRTLLRTIVAAWNRAFVVPVLLVLGERALERGRIDAARSRFASAVRRAPLCFRAHFGLARVLVASGDREGARRELTIARHLAPSRYRELRRGLPAPYRDELPPAGAGWEEVLPVASAAVGSGGSRPAAHGRPGLPEPPADDFVDDAERLRFRGLGPIGADEARDVDWDRIADELSRRDA